MAEKANIKEIRAKIAEVYGIAFAAGLKPRQVFAVYNSMRSRGKFETQQSDYHQMNIFDWLYELEQKKGEHIESFR